MEKSLTVHAVPVASILDVLGPLERAKTDTSLGAVSLSDALQGAQGFTVTDEGGAMVMAFALRIVQHRAARVAWVMAAMGNAPGTDLTRSVLPLIERIAREQGAGQVAVTTKRAGLVKKMQALGYLESGVTLRKNI